jgi:hypothetical protein
MINEMKNFSRKLLKFLIVAAGVSGSIQSRAHNSCALVVQSPTFPIKQSSTYPIRHEVQNSRALSEKLMKEFTKRSNHIKSEKIEIQDFIIVGAGVQGAAAALALKDSGKKALIVEKSNLVASNFGSKEFTINSSETAQFSMHPFPESSLRFDQFTSSKYASSLQLAAYIQSLIYLSKVPVLLGTEMTKLQHNSDGTVSLFTQEGLRLTARNIVIGTGLGEASTKVPDLEYKTEFEKYTAESAMDPTSLKPVMSTETFMRAFNRGFDNKTTIELPPTVLLIGNGDGARITVEEMAESFVKRPQGFKIVWVGQDSKNSKEYIASQGGWDRYIDKVVPFFERGEIQPVTGYTQTIKKLPSGKFQMTVLDQKTSITTIVEGDFIIDSTGYENRTLNLVKQTFAGSELIDVKGSLKEKEMNQTSLAKQVQTAEGQSIPVYLVGPGAGLLATKAELQTQKNRNPVSIYNNVPRTTEVIYKIIGSGSPTRSNGEKLSAQVVLSSEEIYKLISAL